jgi:NitT/TauT family transport system permease protein
MSRSARGILQRLLVVAVFLGVWYLGAALLQLSGDPIANSKLPYPHQIIDRMISSPGTILDATWATGSRAAAGFFIGLAVGTLFGIVLIQARVLEVSLLPYILASQMIPLIALVPIMRAILREPDLVRLYLASYVTFFIVTVAVLRGLKSVDRNALELMASLNAGRFTTLRVLRFPAALPFIFSGMKIAAPLSLIGAIIVDLTGSSNGLGYLMIAAVTVGPSQAPLLWAALVISFTLGLLFSRLVVLAEKRIAPWQPAFRERSA